MPKISTQEFVDVILKSKLADKAKLAEAVTEYRKQAKGKKDDPLRLARKLIKANLITPWQTKKLLDGRYKGFFIGKYKLLSHIGSGGMSSVYLAEHTVMRRRVALKVLPEKLVKDKAYLKRFYRESQATAALDHPNIVRAYDVDNEGNIHYLVMEFVEGSDLEKIVEEDGPLDYETAADYIRQAAEGLAHAHDRKMIHRDIKPANLLVDETGTVKVLDMGLAHLDDAEDESQVNNSGNVMGTTDFLAPEQAMGSKDLDARADIYSLGCTMYYVLTGSPPFPGETLAEVLLKHQTQEPKPIREFRKDCPKSLVAICAKMMAKSPDDRYQTAVQVANSLIDWLSQGEQWDTAHQLSGVRSAEEAEELHGFLTQLEHEREVKTTSKASDGKEEDLSSFLGMLDSEAEEASGGSNIQDDEMSSFLTNLSSEDSFAGDSSDSLYLDPSMMDTAHGSATPPPRKPNDASSSSKSQPKPGSPPPASKGNMEFLCPNGHRLFGPVSLQGQRGACPHCKARFRIPYLDGDEGNGDGEAPAPARRPKPRPDEDEDSNVQDFLEGLGADTDEAGTSSGDHDLDDFFNSLDHD